MYQLLLGVALIWLGYIFAFQENMENNYHLLLTEHLNLQRSLAQLLTTSSSKSTTSEVSDNDEKLIITCKLQVYLLNILQSMSLSILL